MKEPPAMLVQSSGQSAVSWYRPCRLPWTELLERNTNCCARGAHRGIVHGGSATERAGTRASPTVAVHQGSLHVGGMGY